jgi:hypothetical protein
LPAIKLAIKGGTTILEIYQTNKLRRGERAVTAPAAIPMVIINMVVLGTENPYIYEKIAVAIPHDKETPMVSNWNERIHNFCFLMSTSFLY